MTCRLDIHSHFTPLELPSFAQRYGDASWPEVVRTDDGWRIVRHESVYRSIDPSYYDLSARIERLDLLGIDRQVISPLPVMIPQWAEPNLAAEYCRYLNDQIADACDRSGGRLLGLGAVPLQDPESACREMHRLRTVGLIGVELGTWISATRDVGAPETSEFFEEAALHSVPLLLHPNAPSTFCGPTDSLCEFGIGVGSETARAVASLLGAGHLHRHEGLRLCLSHLGGSFFWLWPRLRAMVARAGLSWQHLPPSLWVDTVNASREGLEYVAHFLNNERLLFGSDLPAASDEMALSTCEAVDAMRARLPDGVEFSIDVNTEQFLGLKLSDSTSDGWAERAHQPTDDS